MADLRSASFHPDRPDGYVVPSYDLAGEGSTSGATGVVPVWINTNWLLWNGLVQHGQTEEADAILLSSLGLVARRNYASTSTRLAGRVSAPTGSAGRRR